MGDRDSERDQPLPVNTEDSISVFADMRGQLTDHKDFMLLHLLNEREEYGVSKYGQTLMSHTGRDPLRDAWEEAMDLWAYMSQLVIEQGSQWTPLRMTARVLARSLTIERTLRGDFAHAPAEHTNG